MCSKNIPYVLHIDNNSNIMVITYGDDCELKELLGFTDFIGLSIVSNSVSDHLTHVVVLLSSSIC